MAENFSRVIGQQNPRVQMLSGPKCTSHSISHSPKIRALLFALSLVGLWLDENSHKDFVKLLPYNCADFGGSLNRPTTTTPKLAAFQPREARWVAS